jgi:hypothetical protein
MTQRYGNIDRMNHPTWTDRLKSLLHFELAVEASLPEGSLVVGLVLFGVGLKVGAQTDSTIPFVCWVALYGVGEQIDLCAGLDSYAAHQRDLDDILGAYAESDFNDIIDSSSIGSMRALPTIDGMGTIRELGVEETNELELAVVAIMMSEHVDADHAAAILRGEKPRPSDGAYCVAPPDTDLGCLTADDVVVDDPSNMRPCSKHPDRDGCPAVC